MKRNLLLIVAALLVAASTQARVIEAGENQVWWGYFNESDYEQGEYTIGTGNPMALMSAIYIPANHPQLTGSTIKAVRVYIASDVVSNLSGLKIWVSKSLPNKLADADYSQTTIGTLRAGINDFNLRTPYEVTGEGFYIGYYVKSTTGYFIKCGGLDAPNSFFVGNPEVGFNWTDLNGNGLGKLAFQILVDGGTFSSYNAVAEDFGGKLVLQGESVNIPVTITNYGKETINTISYTIATDGGDVTPEQTLSVGSLAFNGSKTVNLSFSAGDEARKYMKTLAITKVNDEPNESATNLAEGFVITLKENNPVTPVIEEFTGTWCGWCPRGMVGMEKVHEAFGDKVVQIAAHYSDIMAINDYQSVINAYTSGFPNSITDRQFATDPSYSNLNNVLRNAWSRLSQGIIELSAEWEDSDQKAVSFSTRTNFSYSENDGQYGIALVLTEDELTGTGTDWQQANYYNGSGVSGDMSWWNTAGANVSGLKFNHVPVAAWGALNGISGSVSPTIVAGESQEFNYQADISKVSLIQDKTKLKAVALLIDRTSGTIVNAAQTDIKEKGTGISTVTPAAETVEVRYSVDGRKLSTVEKGVNIIRMADGSVRKVLVK